MVTKTVTIETMTAIEVIAQDIVKRTEITDRETMITVFPHHHRGRRDPHSSIATKHNNSTLLHGGLTMITWSMLRRHHQRREEISIQMRHLVKDVVVMITGVGELTMITIGTVANTVAVGGIESDVVQGLDPKIVVAGHARILGIGRVMIDGEEINHQAIVTVTVLVVVVVVVEILEKNQEKEVAIVR